MRACVHACVCVCACVCTCVCLCVYVYARSYQCSCFKIWHKHLDFAFRDFVYRLNADNISLNVSQFDFFSKNNIASSNITNNIDSTYNFSNRDSYK